MPLTFASVNNFCQIASTLFLTCFSNSLISIIKQVELGCNIKKHDYSQESANGRVNLIEQRV